MTVSIVNFGGSLGPCPIHSRTAALPTAGALPTIVQVKSSVQRARSASTSFFLNASFAFSMMTLLLTDIRLLDSRFPTFYSLVGDAPADRQGCHLVCAAASSNGSGARLNCC